MSSFVFRIDRSRAVMSPTSDECCLLYQHQFMNDNKITKLFKHLSILFLISAIDPS
jgi:hypothetical protein